MSVFNQHSRTRNVLQSSVIGAVCNLLNTVFGFVYRSVFIHVLSASYLGINGLFASILQILSITELGISTAITYRFYDPISKNDVQKVGQLLNFFKKVYLLIAAVILVIGLSFFPFLDFFIKDAGEVPSDVNLQLVYLLFLLNTLSSYLFSYKHTILSADQKQYILSLLNTLITFLRYVLQLVSLWLWKNYTLTLFVGSCLTLICNYTISIRVSGKYASVFAVKEIISQAEQKQIYQDTRATMLHKVGGTVLGATDSIVLSKFVSLAATGIHSNYSLLISSLSSILDQLLTSFTASVGNAHVELPRESRYHVYKRLQFLNLWIAGMTTTCLYALINDFIHMWVGSAMLLDDATVIVLCIQFYLQVCRKVNMSYTNACGLFVKDKIRPLIEAALNLLISIVLVKRYGIVGVFAGTVLSCVATVFWREPYILFKYEFGISTKAYWKTYAHFSTFTLCINVLLHTLSCAVTVEFSIVTWIMHAILCILVYNIAAIFVFFRSEELKFYFGYILKFLHKR